MRESVAIAVFVRVDSTHRAAVGSTMRRAWTVNLAAQTSIDRDAEGRIRESACRVRRVHPMNTCETEHHALVTLSSIRSSAFRVPLLGLVRIDCLARNTLRVYRTR